MNRVLQNKWYWLTLLIGTVIFSILTMNTPLRGDDYPYALIPGNESQRCDTLGKYLASMAYFYNDTNGRIADMMVRFFASLLGKTIFNIFNIVVFVIFVHTLVCLITTERKPWLLSCIFLYILLLIPWPGQTMLWMAGAINYMWSATATLLVLGYMVRHKDGNTDNRKVTRHLVLFLAAFVAGGMNESISFATLAGMGGYFLFNFKKWRGTNVTITLAYLLGAFVIILSPGAWNRLESGSSVNLNMGIMQLAMQRGLNLVTKTGHYVTPFLGLVTLCIILCRKGFKKAQTDLFNWILIGTMMSVLIFGITQPRAYTWYSITGLLVFTTAITHYINTHRNIARSVLVATILGSIGVSYYAIKVTYKNKKYSDEAIASVIASPDGVVKAYPVPDINRFYPRVILNNEDETAYTRFFCYYFNKDNVAFINDSLYARYKSQRPFLNGGKRLNFESDHPQWARDIYAYDGTNFSILPIENDSVIDRLGLISKLYYTDLESHIGADRVEKRKLWGTMRNYEPYPQYHLKHDGKMYIILPALNDSITCIEIPVKVGKRNDVLIFNHK